MLLQTFKMAWNSICANKLRTFLTMLGIIIGVAALVLLVSIANGATSSINNEVSSIGTDYMTVSISDDKEKPIKISEFNFLFSDSSIKAASPYSQSSVTGKSGYTSKSMTIYGIGNSYMDIMGLELEYGRFIKNVDLNNNSNVIVLTHDTAVEYFGHANAVGETLSLNGEKYEVIGVLCADTKSTFSFGDSSTTMEGYLPYTSFVRLTEGSLEVTQFYISSSDESSMDAAKTYVTSLLLDRFKNDEDAFYIFSSSEIAEAMESINTTLSLLIGGIAAISLLVGGIGIMNIMLVSVTERTREIGIRKAIGAGKGLILLQFLLESLVVSLMGCAFGILVSWIGIQIVNVIMSGSISASMDINVVMVAVIFSAAIGIIFGLYPARKAANKKPIDALRYEG